MSEEIQTTGGNPLKALLESKARAMAEIATQYLTPDMLIRLVGMCVSKTPKLAECDQLSILTATMTCAQLGLAPDHRGSVYFIPFGRENPVCQLIVGYQGYMTLVRRAAPGVTFYADVVRDGDVWENETTEKGTSFRFVRKAPSTAPTIGAWAAAVWTDRFPVVAYMDTKELDAIQKRSRAANDGPWITDLAEMRKKTVLRRVVKMISLTPEADAALALADGSEFEDIDDNKPGEASRMVREVIAAELPDAKPPARPDPFALEAPKVEEPEPPAQSGDEFLASLGDVQMGGTQTLKANTTRRGKPPVI